MTVFNILTGNSTTLSKERLSGFDLVIAQDIRPNCTEVWDVVDTHPLVVRFPWLLFYGFTPDHTTLPIKLGAAGRPHDNVSRIMAGAWENGLSPAQTQALFTPGFMNCIGYDVDFVAYRDIFLRNLSAYTHRAQALFDRWFDRGVFFHTGNHPKSFVIEDMLRDRLAETDASLPATAVTDFLPDPLLKFDIHPNLNHPAATNRLDDPNHVYKVGPRVITLAQQIDVAFTQHEKNADTHALSQRDRARFDTALVQWRERSPVPTTNPYKRRPDHTFWARAVAGPVPGDVAPGAGLRPVIAQDTRVATAGSCFAQHVARAMVADGLTYYVAETAPEYMEAETVQARGYGLFSARYGNIYSTRQLLQLIRRAYGRFKPIETAWPVKDGYIDPFRPNIGEVFDSPAAVELARKDHLASVREMFEQLDVFVFTLGLTEGWVDRRDGAAFPVVPGAVTRGADMGNFAFENLDYPAVLSDLRDFVYELQAVNPGAQVIFTVSPVPLIATYGEADVLSATTYSKSVLRAAAGDTARDIEAVQYFPSYEIITGSFNRGRYFEDDLRSVRSEGVAHVMDVFRKTLVIGEDAGQVTVSDAPADTARAADFAEEMARQADVVCDEELLVRD